MWKEKINNLKELIVRKKEDNWKKNIENMVVFLIILIVTIIAINTIWNKKNEKEIVSNVQNNIIKENTIQTRTSEVNLEENLEQILAKIEGVGKVSVLITYSETSQVIAMYNEKQKESKTEETDTSGGSRQIIETDSSKEIVYKEENGEKVPITQKVILPKIEGALIIAEGAKNAEVKANIIQAVEAATGLATHKIQVFAMTYKEN